MFTIGYLYIAGLFYFIQSTTGYCISICKNPFIKITKIEEPSPRAFYPYPQVVKDNYFQQWDHGEVEWDFPQTNSAGFTKEILENDLYYYYKTTKLTQPENCEYTNTIYEKYFKNKVYIRVRKTYLKEVYSSLIKNAYKDMVKIETFAYEFQDLALHNMNINSNSVDSDLAMLLITTGLGLIHNKNKFDNIENLKQIHKFANKEERMEDYRKIKRNVGLLFIILTTIFGRNVRNAE